jgi:DNA adenine methylase
MADDIISLFTRHKLYIEPFFGSGGVFFQKKPSKEEIINDSYGEVVHFFRILRDRGAELIEFLELTPFSREEFDQAYEETDDPVERARRFYIRCWMGHTSRHSIRTGFNGFETPEIFQNAVSGLSRAAERLKHATIESIDAVKLCKAYPYSDTLIYADPPYPHSETSRREGLYAVDMSEDEHGELLDALLAHPGPVIISGVEHPLYNNKLLHGPRRWNMKYIGKGNIQSNKYNEAVWWNEHAEQKQQSLF